MSQQNFIGFGTLEDWLAAIESSQPVNADCIVEPGASDRHGVAVCTQAIVCSQVTERGEVLYARVPVGRYQAFAGETRALFEPERHAARALAAWTVAQAWLSDQNLTIRRAVVAMPRNLKLLDGHCAFMRYDQAADSYVRVAEQPLQEGVA
jgi:hypothetical protein